jgi:fructose-1,6-bisphosphatase II
VATGITSADFVEGVQHRGPFVRAESIVMRSYSGTIRHVISDMDPTRWD